MFKKRFFTLSLFIFLYLLILTIRIIFLQVIHSDYLIHEGDRRTLRIQPLFVTRGTINDRNGQILAITLPVNAICLNPTKILNKNNIRYDQKWKDLSKILSISLENIIFRINAHPKSKFIYLARHISPEKSENIKKLQLPEIFLLAESKRYYPSGRITAQLIGLTNIDGKGIDGIEKSFNKILTGKPGKRQIRKNNKGQIIENISLVHQSSSKNIILSIDQTLQKITYKKLSQAVKKYRADSGTAILINIKTGEILAMVNSPSYNPNNVKYAIAKNMRNRAVTDMFEPGSTVKPIVIMEALRLGVIKENSIINTQPYFIKKHIIKDVSYNKQLSITGILQKSSNVGISKIALSIPTKKLINSYLKFGLGRSTKLGLVGEKNGFFPKKTVLSDLEKATFSFGYGLMVTPLQLARLYAVIGSYGIYRPLSIKKINTKTVYGTRIFPKKYIETIIHMMESVAQVGGSGALAAVKGYHIAVKTGTVKKVGKHGLYIQKYVAYTAGIAPSRYPKFSLIVMIDNPRGKKYYGGIVSAPVFSDIMNLVLHNMKIPTDK
ncbi:MAG: peptidoglycan glycosyltransferase FtsI [Buchnera aphidicola (Pentalonia nigronervosa)]|jgi:cell division protein FtsI (penicillin-binding protein 3)|uniref:Peptidoglycan D,D-transpeptidase FtsI n=1 Tax=Buchnera aphidicola (Pentalonia nigronervosa) TaxID=1309793 RepID=A0A7H1AZM8_9GAMM|nr:MAG: peptidoglycan glycosyltransferase FtsI [Buchnera aphidicola (Pentalonia nigronervosa)]